jgi:hypothetical protein
MTTETFSPSPVRAIAALLCAVALVVSCGPDNSQKASRTPSNVMLTDAQLKHIRI